MPITEVTKIATKNVITIPLGASVYEAEQLMAEKRIRHIPVINDLNTIVGVISNRDIANIPTKKSYPVDIFMSTPVEVIAATEPLRTSILHMIEKKISCLLVIDAKGQLVGILTTDDIMWHLAHLLRAESDNSRSLFGASSLQFVGDLINKIAHIGI